MCSCDICLLVTLIITGDDGKFIYAIKRPLKGKFKAVHYVVITENWQNTEKS